MLLESISLDLSTTGGLCSLDFVIGSTGLFPECEVAEDVVSVDGAGSSAFSAVAVVVSAVAVDELLLD